MFQTFDTGKDTELYYVKNCEMILMKFLNI